MRRTLICLLLCAALGLCACGGSSAPQSAPAEEALPGGRSYSDIYMEYLAVRAALLEGVELRIETNNAVLKEQYADSYYMNSNYLVLTYVPFSTVYPGLVSTLADGDDLSGALTELRTAFPDAVLEQVSPGKYEAKYTYVDKTSGQAVDRSGRCVWERDGQVGSFRVQAYIDDELVEFTEFIPQGDDVYLLYTMTDLALVQFSGGRLRGLRHLHRISEPPLGSFPGDMRPFDLSAFDPFPGGGAEDALFSMENDAQYLITLENDVMVYNGLIAQDLTDAQGNKTGMAWQAIEPIVLQD